MYEIKVNLIVELPGRTMLSKQECLKQLKNDEIVEDFDKMEEFSLRIYDPETNKHLTIKPRIRKCKPAIQSLNICKEAYEYMISKNSIPSSIRENNWLLMSQKSRLEYHLKEISESLGGISFIYQVIED